MKKSDAKHAAGRGFGGGGMVERFCPAKLNLCLGVVGLREDAYHELNSLVVPLKFGDTLQVALQTSDAAACDTLAIHPQGISAGADAFACFDAAGSAFANEATLASQEMVASEKTFTSEAAFTNSKASAMVGSAGHADFDHGPLADEATFTNSEASADELPEACPPEDLRADGTRGKEAEAATENRLQKTMGEGLRGGAENRLQKEAKKSGVAGACRASEKAFENHRARSVPKNALSDNILQKGAFLLQNNSVLKAAEAFRKHSGLSQHFAFRLRKRIPVAAGLGGGSSDAVQALLGLNELFDKPLRPKDLHEIALELGSDCPLFLRAGPSLMYGRGERLKRLPAEAAAVLKGLKILLFKPNFGVQSQWAYAQMRRNPHHYSDPQSCAKRLESWLQSPQSSAFPLFNDLQKPVFEKYLALPCLLEMLREKHDLPCLMSGSGSTCFALLQADTKPQSIIASLQDCLGSACFYQLTEPL